MADMRMGDERYRKLMRRWHTLSWLDAPTDRQRKEMQEIDRALHECELRHVRGSVIAAVVDDYELMKNAGDLGGTEL